jgi:hypothetical protein
LIRTFAVITANANELAPEIRGLVNQGQRKPRDPDADRTRAGAPA